MIQKLGDIDALLEKHDTYRHHCLNLIASENYASKRVRGYLCSDFNNRYGCYTTLKPEEREYTGNKPLPRAFPAEKSLASTEYETQNDEPLA